MVINVQQPRIRREVIRTEPVRALPFSELEMVPVALPAFGGNWTTTVVDGFADVKTTLLGAGAL